MEKKKKNPMLIVLSKASGKHQNGLNGLNWLNVAYKPNFWL
jgi:hypothetical protein